MTRVRGIPPKPERVMSGGLPIPGDLKPGDNLVGGDGIEWIVSDVPYFIWDDSLAGNSITVQVYNSEEGGRNFFLHNGVHAMGVFMPIRKWSRV